MELNVKHTKHHMRPWQLNQYLCKCEAKCNNKKAQLMLAYPHNAKTMKKIPPFQSYNKFQSSRKSGVYSN